MAEKKDNSYGIIPVKVQDGGSYFFVIQHLSGYSGFPKGHMEPNETEFEAACRELLEETNLIVDKTLLDKTFEENYTFNVHTDTVIKNVKYFVATVENPDDAFLQQDEISDGQWVRAEYVLNALTYDEAKRLFKEVTDALKLIEI